MNHELAEERINTVSALLKEWGRSGRIGEIEYDLLIDKLKAVYEQVKFANNENKLSDCLNGNSVRNKPNVDEIKESEQPVNNKTVHALYGASDSHYGCKSGAMKGEARAVLGEVIGNVGQTIADKWSAPVSDVASRLRHEKIDSIRKAIGVNDKYLIVHDLFGGNVDAFEIAVMKLDQFTSIEDVMLYIHDNYNWSRENEAARLISDLLVRKLM